METRELILLQKAREIANRSSVRYGGMSFVEALVTMGRWCDANPNVTPWINVEDGMPAIGRDVICLSACSGKPYATKRVVRNGVEQWKMNVKYSRWMYVPTDTKYITEL